MKKIILTLGFATQFLCAQPLNLNWAKASGSTGNDYAFVTAIDNSGNIYYAGQFSGTVDFDPGTGTFPLSAIGANDMYLCKLDNNGNFLWAFSAGSSGTTIAQSIEIDSVNNVYIVGSYTGATDFDPGVGTVYLPVDMFSASQAFVAKYTSSGAYVWAKGFGSASGNGLEYGYGAAIHSNNIYVTGRFAGTTDFDPSATTVNLTSVGSSADIYVSKFDLNGNFLWVRQLGGSSFDYGNSIAVNSQGMVYVTGGFQGSFDADPGPGVNTLTNAFSGFDIFIWKLNSAGNYQNAFAIGSGNEDVGNDIAIDGFDNVYTTGWYTNTIDCDPSIGGFASLLPIGGVDVFLLKMDVNDTYQWAKGFGGTGGDLGRSVSINSINDIVITGKFSSTADFDPNAGIQNLISDGGTDIYLAGISSTGDYQWAAGMGGITDDDGRDVVTDSSGNIFAVGYFTDTADLNPRPSITNLNSQGLSDAYVAKYHLCSSTGSTITEDACVSYISPSGNYTWTNTGVYNDTITNFEGCDSVITINLTITTIDTGLGEINGIITSNQAGGTYQWFDCNIVANISGATSQFYTPTSNGNYGVIINLNGCTDTSSCYSIMNVGVNDESEIAFIIYPNPAEDFTIINSTEEIISLNITNIQGSMVEIKSNLNCYSYYLATAHLESGIYVISIETINGKRTFNLLVN